MLIILEGVDCSGKSTLASELVTSLSHQGEQVELLHRGVPVSHVLDEYELPFFDYIPDSGVSIVCDRWHIGPDVYGPIKRNDGGLDPVVRWHMNSYLTAKGAFLVYTEMPLAALLERMEQRGEDYLNRDEVQTVIDYYRIAINKTPLPHLLSTSGFHPTETFIEAARKAVFRAKQISRFLSYVGPSRPNELYVGMSATPISFMPYDNTLAYKIIKKFGLENPFSAGFIDSSEQLDRVWDALYNPQVFALDQASADACTYCRIPFTQIEEKTWNN